MREIGSEFWIDENFPHGTHIEASRRKVNLLSGRTALDFIIRDAQKCGKLECVMLPSYCCETMIEPFIRNHVKVSFYSVQPHEIIYDFANDCDAVLVIDYFGYITAEMIEIARKEAERSKIVIYDSTHMIGGNPNIEVYADYSICSYRKWIYCNNAIAMKHKSNFEITIPHYTNETYITLRNDAANSKARYIQGEKEDKEYYLNQFQNANHTLAKDYVGYAGDGVTPRIDIVRQKRRDNANQLIEGLYNVNALEFWHNQIDKDDIPLFVPVLLNKTLRAELRQHLIGNGIYCPIHWPMINYPFSEKERMLYETELSLICDQRYDASDIQREIEAVKCFFSAI